MHPGGSDKLLMASGGPIEPFWQQYPFHKKDDIYALLA
jgi:sulfite oxidase